jgi:hypothetical protein
MTLGKMRNLRSIGYFIFLGMVGFAPLPTFSAPQDDLVLTAGVFAAKDGSQPISVQNKSDRAFAGVNVECGFFDSAGQLVGSGATSVTNLAANSVGYATVNVLIGHGATSAKCRISGTR